jgi:hypothetical protein
VAGSSTWPIGVSALRRATIVPVDEPLALEAAEVSRLVTSDTDFDGLPGAVVVK